MFLAMHSALGYGFGMGLSTLGACLYALGMCQQRYALAYPEERVPAFGRRLNRVHVWIGALLVTQVGNIAKEVGKQFAPFTVCSSLFSLLLVFNLGFAYGLNGEAITQGKVAGAVLIFAGALQTVGTTPDGLKQQFNPAEVREFFSRMAGIGWCLFLVAAMATSLVVILHVERTYPLPQPREEPHRLNLKFVIKLKLLARRAQEKLNPERRSLAYSGPLGLLDRMMNVRMSLERHADERARGVPMPAQLNALMMVFYPVSLGIMEALMDLTPKLLFGMLAQCGAGHDCGNWGDVGLMGALVLTLSIVGGLNAVWWIPVVYARYETTTGLPIEYGSLNVFNVCTGLLFFKEYEDMELHQGVLLGISVGFIVLGATLNYLAALRPSGEAQALLSKDVDESWWTTSTVSEVHFTRLPDGFASFCGTSAAAWSAARDSQPDVTPLAAPRAHLAATTK